MQIEVNNKAVLKTAGKYVAEDITIIAKGGNLPQLFAPSISLSGNTLTITPNASNGGFSTDYSIYDGSTFIKTITATTIDLSTVFAESTTQHTVTVQATADNFQNSAASNSVNYANIKTYSITAVLTGFAASASNPTSINTGEQKSLSFALNDGYEFPESNPTVTGASFVSWSSSGVLVIKNPTENVTITITATKLPDKLATPTNVTVDGTTVSWDEVTNATSYDIYVDGAVYETIVAQEPWTATVTDLGSSSPSAVTFTKSSNFPTNFEEVTKDGDVFIKIPTMYRKVNTVSDNQITSFTISNAKEDDTYLPYPCFVRPDGSVMDYILIGKYMISNSSTANSVNATSVSLTPAQGIALCKNKGAGYYPYDVWTQKLFQDLELAIGKKVNYQDGSATITVSKIGLNHLDQTNWVFGVIGSSGSWYACYDPDKYQALERTSSSIPQSYVKIGYTQPTTEGEIQKLGYDESNQFFNYPTAAVLNNSYNTYYCDFYGYSSGNRPVYSLVGYSSASVGLWDCNADLRWATSDGVRLCYRPISN